MALLGGLRATGGVDETRSIEFAGIMATAAVLLGVCSTLWRPFAMVLIVLALLTVCLGVLARVRYPRVLNEPGVQRILYLGIGLEVFADAFHNPLLSGDLPLTAVMAATGALGVCALVFAPQWRRFGLVTIVIGHFAITSYALATREDPLIDVHRFQQEASAALLEGRNPYGLRYENLYGAGSPYYAREVEDGNRLRFGFPYPPLSLMMALPGYVVGRDYRYAALAAVSATALLIGFSSRGAYAAGAALLVLFAPLTQHVLYWGWTEPFVALAFALAVFTAVRRLSSVPVALGLLVATKQYAPVLLPAAVVLLQRTRDRVGWLRMVFAPLAVAAVTVLPFVVWDRESFVYSTVTLHHLTPFRVDSWSIPAVLVKAGQELGRPDVPQMPGWIGMALAAAALGLVLTRVPRTPAGFCAGSAILLLVIFLFSRAAFLNYYFAVFVMLACGLAAAEAGRQRRVVQNVPAAGPIEG